MAVAGCERGACAAIRELVHALLARLLKISAGAIGKPLPASSNRWPGPRPQHRAHREGMAARHPRRGVLGDAGVQLVTGAQPRPIAAGLLRGHARPEHAAPVQPSKRLRAKVAARRHSYGRALGDSVGARHATRPVRRPSARLPPSRSADHELGRQRLPDRAGRCRAERRQPRLPACHGSPASPAHARLPRTRTRSVIARYAGATELMNASSLDEEPHREHQRHNPHARLSSGRHRRPQPIDRMSTFFETMSSSPWKSCTSAMP